MNPSPSATWEKFKLGSLGEFRNGVNFAKGCKGHGLKLINVKDIFQGGRFINFDSLDRVDLLDMKGIEKYFVQQNDIFFVRSSVKRDGIGLVNIAMKSDKEAVHCGFIIRFRLSNPEVDPLFLTYTLRSPHYRKVIVGISGGAAIINISQDVLASLNIILPPHPTQQKIASVLSAYDDLIENNTKRIKIMEEMSKIIYREWFVNFRFPGHEKVKMIKSDVGMIPEGWQMKKLRDLAEINKRSINKNNSPEDILYVDISSVSTGSINEAIQYKFSDAPGRARRKVKHGDTIWSSVRPNRKSYALIIDPDPKTIVSTGFAVLSPVSVPYTFLYETVTTDDFVGYLTSNTRGAAYPAVNTEDYERANILVPTNEQLKQFHETVEDFYLLKSNLQQRNANLRKTRDLLLPKLINGEIDVENLDINTESVQ